MSGDPFNKNEDELLSQIDELKARMDRLMSGGTSTSNSALLTDAAKAASRKAEPALVEQPADPAPNRTRVRDLIGPDDEEVVEPYPETKAVPFPDEDAAVPPVAEEQTQPEPESEPPPKTRPERSGPVGGSVITVDDDGPESRPQVASFDDLGSAIQEELAKDVSVPPADQKKGPDLASRFGPVGESVAEESRDEAPEEEEPEDAEPVEEAELETLEDEEEPEVYEEPAGRGRAGLVAAIWVLTALASGTIAALHFSGMI